MAALVVDGLIIVGYFIAIVWIGLRLGRRDSSLHEFALGGRRVPWWAVMASIIAAETSAATFLGAPGEGYKNLSLAYVQLIIGLILGRVLVGVFFLGPYYRYNVYTVYDYLDIRFGAMSKGYVSALFLIMRTLASGTRLFVPSLVIVLAWQLFTSAPSSGDGITFSQTAVTSVWPYVFAITGLVIVTCVYTAVGGIKAVIWTDVIQATLMFTSALVAVGTLLYHIGGDSWNLMNGFRALGQAVPAMTSVEGYFITGLEQSNVDAWMKTHNLQAMRPLDYVWMILGSQYTLFSAVIAATAANMAQFGTDQDMVQRMLTAETAKKASRSLITAAIMDLPIAAAFTFIGILLYVYYQQDPRFKPASNADVFGSYILNVMPPVIRGFVLAGVFATAMGSLSAALNALATSATNDWYLKYSRRMQGTGGAASEEPPMGSTAHSMSAPASGRTAGQAKAEAERASVTAARWFTLLFAVLMVLIAVAFAYAKVRNPDLRIIPVVLGIAGFIIGPMLGVFLLGMFTKRRGSDIGNIIAITAGLVITILMAGWHVDAAIWLSGNASLPFATLWRANVPTVAFTWYALIGALVVVAVGVWFPTPAPVLARAIRIEAQAHAGDKRPLELRGHG